MFVNNFNGNGGENFQSVDDMKEINKDDCPNCPEHILFCPPKNGKFQAIKQKVEKSKCCFTFHKYS